jgi:hypothetical protein
MSTTTPTVQLLSTHRQVNGNSTFDANSRTRDPESVHGEEDWHKQQASSVSRSDSEGDTKSGEELDSVIGSNQCAPPGKVRWSNQEQARHWCFTKLAHLVEAGIYSTRNVPVPKNNPDFNFGTLAQTFSRKYVYI